MFQLDDRVLYGIHGVCRILDIGKQKVDKRFVEYYVLEPVNQPGTRFYVPTQNPLAVSKLRPMISQKELEELLHAKEGCHDPWIEDENQRKQYYRDLIADGDRAALIHMVHALHRHRDEQITLGKKFHLCDENFLRDAEKLLHSEFSIVLNMSQEEVSAYIQTIMNAKG